MVKRPPTLTSLFLGLTVCLGCVSLGDLGKDATLRCTVVLRSASGEPLAGYPILASTQSLWLDPASRVIFTDSEGRIELTERRVPDPETFALHAPIRQWEHFYFYLPAVHSEGMYPISFLMDPDHPRWAEIEQERILKAPDRIESNDMTTDGSYRRRVSLIKMTWGMGPVPRHPELEVEARAAPLLGERGYQLHLELTLLDAPDQAAPRAELLRTLRQTLDRVAAGQQAADADLRAFDITLFIGAGRAELLRALGEPAHCIDQQTLDYQGSSRPYVPCSTGYSDAVYTFYRLPPNSRGGGPELHLRFNETGRCNSTRWEFTQ